MLLSSCRDKLLEGLYDVGSAEVAAYAFLQKQIEGLYLGDAQTARNIGKRKLSRSIQFRKIRFIADLDQFPNRCRLLDLFLFFDERDGVEQVIRHPNRFDFHDHLHASRAS